MVLIRSDRKRIRDKEEAMEWRFSQVFGERTPGEEIEDVDIISAIEFDKCGKYIATGDHGGRVVLFKRTNAKDFNDEKQVFSRKMLEHMDYHVAEPPKYSYITEFQSHEPDFDYLKSLEIQEKITKLRWCTSSNDSLFILSTNDRTIKLWKVSDCKVKKMKEADHLSQHVSSENSLLAEQSFTADPNNMTISNGYRLEWINKKPDYASPSFRENWNTILNDLETSTARCRRVFSHAHDFNINSISTNSDAETFISADDLRINLWNLEITNQCFNILDMKPFDMEDLVEVITSAEFHPSHCNLLAYSSSRGFLRLVDMRRSALCDQNARILQDREAHGSRSFFTEIVASISDIKFAKDGRHILSRDYMNLKLWDLHMESAPIATFKMHEHLRPKLSELYTSDSIFDKFNCCLSMDGRHFASGTYGVFSLDGGHDDGLTLKASKTPNRASHLQAAPKAKSLLASLARTQNRRESDSIFSGKGISSDFQSKIIHLAWHPIENLIACAAANSLYTFQA
ncbi:serine/threonine protein phosphatase 2A 55 kDa regulatory subunit B beta isoform-like isoform X2 [Dioscorea cayenensis subsp. rotundata]|uniref:Serine/threonine-protein phosphatase 2A 55 kDa regulatory subunit B n=1 Tax=Dioscorea cayennensis subsp. rotundata TaxID=55577 RepID=A0AB40CVU6_DIOCR|nr:serine/threonine protein phosphatase 2A 55 kDa regulatory subunit B beta isoform-like isoform X2 [Dioscorea cayenensis subsp. rotundata]